MSDIATLLPNASFVDVPYGFGLSSVLSNAPVVALKMYALPDPVPNASFSPSAPTMKYLLDAATLPPNWSPAPVP